MSLIRRLRTTRAMRLGLIVLAFVLLSGCGSTFRNRLTGSWIGPTMEYEFHPSGDMRYAFRTSDGPRWMSGQWWVEAASDERATIKFRRRSPSPRQTYTFTALFEEDNMIQLSKKHGKYRLVRSEYAIAGRFEGPWKGREKFPYWYTVRSPISD